MFFGNNTLRYASDTNFDDWSIITYHHADASVGHTRTCRLTGDAFMSIETKQCIAGATKAYIAARSLVSKFVTSSLNARVFSGFVVDRHAVVATDSLDVRQSCDQKHTKRFRHAARIVRGRDNHLATVQHFIARKNVIPTNMACYSMMSIKSPYCMNKILFFVTFQKRSF